MDFGDMQKALSRLRSSLSSGGSAEEAAKWLDEMEPSHHFLIDFALHAEVDGHPYTLEAEVTFGADIFMMIQSMGLSPDMAVQAFSMLGIPLDGNMKEAVLQQIQSPRSVGKLMDIKIHRHHLEDESGSLALALPSNPHLMLSLKDGQIGLNLEKLFEYPEARTKIFNAVPSLERMESNISIPYDELDREIEFLWEEPLNNLKMKGSLEVFDLS